MAAPFATLQTRINQAAIGHLANVDAIYNGAVIVSGVFDADYIDPLGVESAGPVFRCLSSAIPGAAHNDTVVISATTYKVRGVRHDGAGMTLLKLELQ